MVLAAAGRAAAAAVEFRYKDEFGRTGRGRSELERPSGIAVSEQGFIAVTDRKRNTVSIYDKDGYWERSLGKPKGEGPVEFDSPQGVAIDKTGRIWVADTGNDRVVAINRSGGIIRVIGGFGRRRGDLSKPAAVAIGRDGRIFVADYGNRRIQIFSENGVFLDKWEEAFTADKGPIKKPVAIAYSDTGRGRLWIANEGSSVLRSVDMDGRNDLSVDLGKLVEGEIKVAGLLVESGMDRVMVLDQASSRVLVLGIGQALESRINLASDANPAAFAVDWSVNVYIADDRMRRVIIYERY